MGLATGIFFMLCVPSYLSHVREEALQMGCASNMKNILLALRTYHEQFGSFPPAYTVDAEEKKLQSWRVLILPQLGKEELYRQIRLDEPWDSDHNKQFHSQMPDFYFCPAERSMRRHYKNSYKTSYVWMIGPGLISDGTSCMRMSDLSNNTPVLVETLAWDCWMSPEDMTMERCWVSYTDWAHKGPFMGIRSNHRTVTTIGFADGFVMCIH